jgi:ubiquinone/menaquinone biosynthesis C-methylase UbiE
MKTHPRTLTMKNYLYKLVIYNVTDLCYDNCLNYFPSGSRILDVGIGNGMMLRNYHGLIKSKNFSIVGIDINKDYLSHCNNLIRDCRLEEHIKIFHEPVECYEPPEEGYFDYILFSMSFMLFSDQELVLDRVKKWLKPGGKILFFQTMFHNRSLFMEFIKPKLKYVTTVDFGRVTYDENFFDLLRKMKLSIDEDRLIKKECFKGEYRLIISSPENAKAAKSELKITARMKPALLNLLPSRKAERKSNII